MTAERTSASKMLSSHDWFSYLRATMSRTGLAKEEKYGIAVFFAACSRFRPNPLRLFIREKTKGAANYLMTRVAKFMPPQSVIAVCAKQNQSWSRFVASPERKLIYVPDWTELSGNAGQVRIEVHGNQLSRVTPVTQEERVVEDTEQVEARFACVSAHHLCDWQDRARWLSIYLRKPPASNVNGNSEPNSADFSIWHEVQDLLAERAELPILIPDWAELFVEQACENEMSCKRLPAFLQAWKTMCLIRSFQPDHSEEVRRGVLTANFSDLAMTALLVKSVFWEARWFPSPGKIFKQAFRAGQSWRVVHPLTGKGIKYSHDPEPAPEQWGRIF